MKEKGRRENLERRKKKCEEQKERKKEKRKYEIKTEIGK